jgi:SPX domain protein involved in polyphosphate accumulation
MPSPPFTMTCRGLPQGFHKILKKHDKALPHAPCRQFYVTHLHQQPWVQGNYSDLLVALSNVYSKLRGDTSGLKNDDAAQVGGRVEA